LKNTSSVRARKKKMHEMKKSFGEATVLLDGCAADFAAASLLAARFVSLPGRSPA
jgi:hypothetical protein